MLGNYPLLGVDTGFLTGPTPQSFRSCWPGRRCWRRSFPRHVACAPRHARHADHCVELRTASCRPKSRRRSRRRGSSLPTMLLRATPTDSLSPSGPTTARRACLTQTTISLSSFCVTLPSRQISSPYSLHRTALTHFLAREYKPPPFEVRWFHADESLPPEFTHLRRSPPKILPFLPHCSTFQRVFWESFSCADNFGSRVLFAWV